MSINYTPGTYATGHLMTAAEWATEVQNPLTGIQAAWTSYTPTWTAATTNPVLGNGSFSGTAWSRVGKSIDFRIVLTMGSTTTYGTGQWMLTLPVAPLSTARLPFLTDYFDASPAGAVTGSATWSSASSVLLLNAPATTAGNPNRAVGSTVPQTWATGDVVTITGRYESV